LIHTPQLGMSLWNGLLQPFINTISTCNGQLQSKIKWCLVSFPKSVHVFTQVISEVLCRLAALCIQIISASSTIAAVTKMHCLCDVSCYLAMDSEILQGSFLRTYMSALIKFRMFGKSALRMLQVVEGMVRDTRSFICNCLLIGKCH